MPMLVTSRSALVTAAEAVAVEVLRDLPERLLHSAGVARRATELRPTVDPADRDLLVAAAWLHDVGYGADAQATGLHSVDGAAYLRRHGWPERICALVAHHSCAVLSARARGLDGLLAEFAEEKTAVADALTYADQTAGPRGQRVTIDERMSEMLARHGQDSVQAQIHPVREPQLRAIARRVEDRLRYSG
jgi:putative nucleotidyltransferase with HDIG domain